MFMPPAAGMMMPPGPTAADYGADRADECVRQTRPPAPAIAWPSGAVKMRRIIGRTPSSSTRSASSDMTPTSTQCMRSSLVNCRKLIQPVGSAIGIDGRLGEPEVGDLDLVAALGVEADGAADERGNAIDLLLAARLIGELALVVLGVDAVHHDRDRDALDAAALDHLGLGGARDLVVDDFLGLAVLVALLLPGRRRCGRIGARQFVADRDRAGGWRRRRR